MAAFSSGIPSTTKALKACQQVCCKCCIGRQNIARWVGGQGHEHWWRACHRIIVRVGCALVVELACCSVKIECELYSVLSLFVLNSRSIKSVKSVFDGNLVPGKEQSGPEERHHVVQ